MRSKQSRHDPVLTNPDNEPVLAVDGHDRTVAGTDGQQWTERSVVVDLACVDTERSTVYGRPYSHRRGGSARESHVATDLCAAHQLHASRAVAINSTAPNRVLQLVL